jgi:hypothetical protein
MMAIPSWTWPTDDTEPRAQDALSEATTGSESSDIQSKSKFFELLSSEIRLEILTTLYSAAGPLSYTELRNSTSIDDKGKFNYHLRQLTEFLVQQNGTYRLTATGERILQQLFTNEQLSSE